MRAVSWAILLFLTASTPAFAEVMDKVSTVTEVWESAVLWSVIALVLGRLHPALGLLLLFANITALSVLKEFVNPLGLGQAIRQEAGLPYVAQVYAANGLMFICYVCGVFWWNHGKRLRAAKEHAIT